MSERVRVETDESGSLCTLHLRGEIDISNVDEFSAALRTAVPNNAKRVVVDLSQLEYLDSAGIALIFRFVERIRGRRQDVSIFVQKDAPIRRPLEVAGLLTLAT